MVIGQLAVTNVVLILLRGSKIINIKGVKEKWNLQKNLQ